MSKKIFLSSNIPISLPEKLSHNNFSTGFIYNYNSLGVKIENKWFEKLCISLNKINSVVGFQTSDLKIPEYIAGSLSFLNEQLGQNQLTVRYNAQTKVNDLIGKVLSKQNELSFNDNTAKSFTKGNQIILLGEKTLKTIFPQFEQIFGLESKIKFIVNHEFAHNLDSIRGYNRSDVSIKSFLANHLDAHINNSVSSPFNSNTEFKQAKDLSKQIWKVSLEQYADVNGFLNMRNELLESGKSNVDIIGMLNVIIAERKENFQDNANKYLSKANSPEAIFLQFKEKFDCLRHFTNLALNDLKERLTTLGDKKISNEDIEKMAVDIVNKADFKVMYAIYSLDGSSKVLIDKLFETEVNDEKEVVYCASKKEKFQQNLQKIVGLDWIVEIDKFVLNNKNKCGFYQNIEVIFSSSLEKLQNRNNQDLNKKIDTIRQKSYTIGNDQKNTEITIKR